MTVEGQGLLWRYVFLLTLAVAVAFVVLYCTEPHKFVGVEVTARTTAQARWIRGIPVSNTQEILGLKLVYNDNNHIGYATGYQTGTGYLNSFSPDDRNAAAPTLELRTLTQPASVQGFVNSLDMAGNYVLYGDINFTNGLTLGVVNGETAITTVGVMPMLPGIAQPYMRYHAVLVTQDDSTLYVVYCLNYCYADNFGPNDPIMVAYRFTTDTSGQTTQTTFQTWTRSQMPFQLVSGLRGTKNGFLMLGNTATCAACTPGPTTLMYVPLGSSAFAFQTASATVLPEMPPANPGGVYGSTLSFGLAASANGLAVAAQNNYVVPEIWLFSLASGTLTKTQVIPASVLNCQFGNTMAFSEDGQNLAVSGDRNDQQGSWIVHVFPRINSGASAGQYSVDPAQYSSIYSVSSCTLASDGYYYPNIVVTTHAAVSGSPAIQRVIFATRDPTKGPNFYRLQNFSAPWTPLA